MATFPWVTAFPGQNQPDWEPFLVLLKVTTILRMGIHQVISLTLLYLSLGYRVSWSGCSEPENELFFKESHQVLVGCNLPLGYHITQGYHLPRQILEQVNTQGHKLNTNHNLISSERVNSIQTMIMSFLSFHLYLQSYISDRLLMHFECIHTTSTSPHTFSSISL